MAYIDDEALFISHFDGEDGATDFTDSSFYPHTINTVGSPVKTTTYQQFGTASVNFDGASYLSIPNHADFQLGSGDFTIDFQARDNIGTGDLGFFGMEGGGGGFLYMARKGSSLRFRDYQGLGVNISVGWTPIVGTFYHCAIDRYGNLFTIFINGEIIATQTIGGSMLARTSPLFIGASFSTNYMWNGQIDEFRWSKGVSRYEGEAFTPEIAAYERLNTAWPNTWSSAKGCSNKHASAFTGIDHLEDQAISVLADGVVVDDITVDNGAIALDTSASQVKVGLPYDSEFETLNVEIPTKEGSLQGQHVKISNVTFRLINSRGGYIGPEEDVVYEALTADNLDKGKQDAPKLSCRTADLYTADVRVPLGAGYKRGGRIYYKQTDPLPITIGAVIPEVSI